MPDREKTNVQWIWLVLSLVVAEDTIDIQHSKQAPHLLPVSVEVVAVSPETVEISAYAEIRPRWSAQLRAAVSGQITEVHQAALAGQQVNEGETLVSIEPSNYIAELSAAVTPEIGCRYYGADYRKRPWLVSDGPESGSTARC
jgi:multidrug efflux pump subunit AcrA (membrane-fusion protein)